MLEYIDVLCITFSSRSLAVVSPVVVEVYAAVFMSFKHFKHSGT